MNARYSSTTCVPLGVIAVVALVLTIVYLAGRSTIPSDKCEEIRCLTIAYINFKKGTNEERCAGIMFENNLVATAAHCVIYQNKTISPTNISIVFYNFTRFGHKTAIKEVAVHKINLDIAVLKLKDSPSFSFRTPCSFNGSSDHVYIFGYSKCNDSGDISEIPLVKPGIIVDPKNCNYENLPDSIKCVKPVGQIGFCLGDSGAPVIDYFGNLIGILSGGNNVTGDPVVVTDTSSLEDLYPTSYVTANMYGVLELYILCLLYKLNVVKKY